MDKTLKMITEMVFDPEAKHGGPEVVLGRLASEIDIPWFGEDGGLMPRHAYLAMMLYCSRYYGESPDSFNPRGEIMNAQLAWNMYGDEMLAYGEQWLDDLAEDERVTAYHDQEFLEEIEEDEEE